MRLTDRDIRIIRDIALSHVLSRDQLLRLGYCHSIPRINARLRGLIQLGFVRRLETPFFHQSLYAASKRAGEAVGHRIAPLVEGRTGSPRFLLHALMVAEARLALRNRGATEWRFEPQLWASVSIGSTTYQVRPDGMALIPGKGALLIEVDLGHVNPAKFGQKLRALDHFVASGEAERLWGASAYRLLTLTTGPLRARHLQRLTPPDSSVPHVCETFASFGLPTIGSWS